jgi:hypothetical protein
MIKKQGFTIFTQVYVSQTLMDELKRIIEESEILKEDDKTWPEPDRVGRQELEIVIGDEHISFTVSIINDRQPRSDLSPMFKIAKIQKAFESFIT